MHIKNFAAAALFCAAFLPQAQASMVSITARGTIDFGADRLGLFGTPGADLTGQNFSETISFEYTAGVPEDHSIYSYSYNDTRFYDSAPVTVSATINGVTWSNTYLSGIGQQYVSNGFATLNSANRSDKIYGYAQGSSDIGILNTYQYIESQQNAFLGLSLDLEQRYTYDSQPGDVGQLMFTLQGSGTGLYTEFYAAPSSMSLNDAPDTDLPEPATIGLFCLGLAGLAVSRRQRAQR